MTTPGDQDAAHRRFGPVYFTELTLADVRCFGPEQRLQLTDGDRPAKWTVILGENGVGKTTLLQCLWAIAPQLVERNGMLLPRGFTESERIPLRRNASSTASLDATVALGERFTSPNLGIKKPLYFKETAETGTREAGGYSRNAYPLCCGYGALRRSGDGSVEEKGSDNATGSLFSDNAVLISGSEWLLRADYAANTTKDAQAIARRDKIQDALIALLPDVSALRVAGLSDGTPKPRIEVETPYGWVPMRALGLGYRSMIAWVVDFASRMFEAFPDSADPLAEPAIALVDEIDLHLHPRWQRDITAHLDRLFPNVQFIVTAHSPLIVQGAGVTNVAVLRRAGDHVEIINDPEEVRGWRVDQILTSDLFGLRSARPAEVELLLERQQQLVLLDSPTDAERAELVRIDAQLANLAPGETPRERETWAKVRRLAERMAGTE